MLCGYSKKQYNCLTMRDVWDIRRDMLELGAQVFRVVL